MPLVLIIFFGVYTPWVALNTVADNIEQDHPYWCLIDSKGQRYYSSMRERTHYDVPGWRWVIPWPFRKGKVRVDFVEGDNDECSGEKFNGKWWYTP